MADVGSETSVGGEWDLESTVLRLISEAGEARGLVYEALGQALAGAPESARQTISRADEHLRAAHAVQFEELVVRECRGEHVPITLLVIHGMDLLMTAASERDLASTIIESALGPKALLHILVEQQDE